jgi:arylsulfatase
MHEMKFFNGILETPDEAVEHLDEIGGPHSHTNYPWGWAQVGNTPFKWYKQNTHEGGVHVPLVVHYPDKVTDAGGIRRQFHHVNDLAATVYDMLGIEAPATRNGLEQMPVSGVPMTYTFTDADAATAKEIQYYEMAGHRGLWHNGWKAVTRHEGGVPFDEDRWELYNLAEDPSECNDLAEAMPEKLTEMIDLWWQEAEKEGVLPLDERMIELFGNRYRERSPHPADMHYVYRPPMSDVPGQAGATLGGRSWTMTASVDGVADGVLYSTGTENSGVAFFVKDGHLVFDYNAFDDHTIVRSGEAVSAGATEFRVDFLRVAGRRGIVRLSVDASLGRGGLSPVSREYTGRFPYGGRVKLIDIQLHHRADAETMEAEMRAELSRQ